MLMHKRNDINLDNQGQMPDNDLIVYWHSVIPNSIILTTKDLTLTSNSSLDIRIYIVPTPCNEGSIYM